MDYDHPDARPLVDEVQQEYVTRYGEQDITVVDPGDFVPPSGLFLLGYLDGTAVVTGAWRARQADEPGLRDGDAEIKRMYVVPEARGLGLARRMLAELERTAVSHGRKRMVLETGFQQPEAIALYRTSGYSEITKFGVYRYDSDSICFAKEVPPACAQSR